MTYRALREQIRRQLEKAGCDSPAFDADCLLEDLGGGRDAAHSDRDVPEECRLAVERAAAETGPAVGPLQYILGRWGFLRLTLEVGEGVLIPRPETELLWSGSGGPAPRRRRQAASGVRSLRRIGLCRPGAGQPPERGGGDSRGAVSGSLRLSRTQLRGLSGLCRQAGSSGYLPGCRPVSGPGGRDPFQPPYTRPGSFPGYSGRCGGSRGWRLTAGTACVFIA